jgi:ubiquinone/menaquinone biosynthesis C-methylase UbiE
MNHAENPIPGADQIKRDILSFYRAETGDRDTSDWLERGGAARVPESRSAHYFVGRKVAEAIEMSALPADAHVLEVGCSFGQMTFLLTDHFALVTAVDLSPDALGLARKRAERYGVGNASFVLADAEDLSALPDASVDGAFSFSVLRYVPDPEQALREMYRVLRPGGSLVVDFPNRYCPWFGPIKGLLGINPHIHDRLYAAAEARRLVERAGFSDVGYRHILFTTRRLPDALLPTFRVADAVLERVPLVNRLAAIVMVSARKR